MRLIAIHYTRKLHGSAHEIIVAMIPLIVDFHFYVVAAPGGLIFGYLLVETVREVRS